MNGVPKRGADRRNLGDTAMDDLTTKERIGLMITITIVSALVYAIVTAPYWLDSLGLMCGAVLCVAQ